MTALHHAALGGFKDAVAVLLDEKWIDKQIDPDSKDNVSSVETYIVTSLLSFMVVY